MNLKQNQAASTTSRFSDIGRDCSSIFGATIVLGLILFLLTSDALQAAFLGTGDSIQPPHLVIKITRPVRSIQCHDPGISIIKSSGTQNFSGFGFDIGYDPTVFKDVSAELGSALDKSGCDWKYFTYKIVQTATSPGDCPLTILQVKAAVDSSTNSRRKATSVPDGGELVRLKMYVTADRTYEGTYSPVRFCWTECTDNAFISSRRDSLFVSRRVIDMPGWQDGRDSLRLDEITGADCQFWPHFGGICGDCDSLRAGQQVAHLVDFENGGVDVIGLDVDIRGLLDLNLNGTDNEIGDAKLLADLLRRGAESSIWSDTFQLNSMQDWSLGISDHKPQHDAMTEVAWECSDVNRDGRPMTIADLVFLRRIIVGDEVWGRKPEFTSDSAFISFANGDLSVESRSNVAGVIAVFNCDSVCTAISQSALPITSFYDTTARELRVLGVCDADGPDSGRLAECRNIYLPAGHNKLLTIGGNAKLVAVQLSDNNGSLLYTYPDSIPPPFISTSSNDWLTWPGRKDAKIAFYLPRLTEWSIEVFGVRGAAQSLSGRDVGFKEIKFDATNWCPGPCSYHFKAGTYTVTRSLQRW